MKIMRMVCVAGLAGLLGMCGCPTSTQVPNGGQAPSALVKVLVFREAKAGVTSELWVWASRSRLKQLGVSSQELASGVQTVFDEIGEMIAEVVAEMVPPEGEDSSTTRAAQPPEAPSRGLQILFAEGIELELIKTKDGRVLSHSKTSIKLKFDSNNTEHNANE